MGVVASLAWPEGALSSEFVSQIIEQREGANQVGTAG